MKKIAYLASSVLLLTFYTCKPDKEQPTDTDLKLAPNTIWIDENTSQYLQNVDSVVVVFSGNSVQLQNLKSGDIIVSGVATNAPNGYLRRVLEINHSGNEYVLTTEEVPLTEAFEELHVQYLKDFTLDDTAKSGQALSFSLNFPNIVVYDGDGNIGTTTDQVRLNGDISFTPSFSVNIDISKFNLNSAKVEAKFVNEINNTLTLGGNVNFFSKEITVYQQPLAPFTIPGTPIVIVPYLRVNIGATGTVNASITASYTNKNTISTYIKYDGNIWEKGFLRSMENTFVPPTINGNASMKAYVEPGIDFSFYGSTSATGSVITQGYIKATGALLPTLGCEVKAGISAGAEAKLKIFGWNFASVTYPDIFDYSTVLYSCSGASASPTANFTANATNIGIGQTINFTDLSMGTPTTWQWTFQGANQSSSTAQNPSGISYNTPGTYNISLTASNANGNGTEVKTGYITVSVGGNAPVADFSASQTNISVGQSISFTDLSTNNPTSWQWSFQGGTPSSSTLQNPTNVTYNTAGTYNVTLVISNANGSDTEIKSGHITVGTSQGCGTITDIDGNVYQTVQIGTQCWMAENLKTTRYRNGDIMPTGLSNTDWQYTTSGAYCYYDNNVAYNAVYGKLYNGYAAVDARNICPTGWHIPNSQEWDLLYNYLGGYIPNIDKMKSLTLWETPNTGATNSSGFNGKPAGSMIWGNFSELGRETSYWSSSGNQIQREHRSLGYSVVGLGEGSSGDSYLKSCRCVKN